MHRKLALTVILAVALAVTGDAQQKSFSGKWEIDQVATDAANPPTAVAGRGGRLIAGVTGFPITITQTADSFAIERRSGDGGATTTTTYKLDGVERDVKTSQGSVKARARWDAAKIVIETIRTGEVTTTTYAIDKDGVLWVETRATQGTSTRAYKKTT